MKQKMIRIFEIEVDGKPVAEFHDLKAKEALEIMVKAHDNHQIMTINERFYLDQ